MELMLSASIPGQLEKADCKLGAGPSVFVPEKHVRLFPFLRSQPLDPLFTLLVRVFLPPQAHITPAAGADQLGGGGVHHVGDAQRTGLRAKTGEYFIVEPARMPELESSQRSLAQEIQEGFQS